MIALQSLLTAFYQIIDSLRSDLSIWWFLAPIFILWVASEFYYGEHSWEGVGFSSAFTSAVSLLWTTFIAFKYFFELGNFYDNPAFWAAGIFILYGVFIFYTSFSHSFSKKTFNCIAAPGLIYFISLSVIIWSVGDVALTLWTAIDLFLFFLTVSAVFFVIKKYFLGGTLGDIERIKNIENK